MRGRLVHMHLILTCAYNCPKLINFGEHCFRPPATFRGLINLSLYIKKPFYSHQRSNTFQTTDKWRTALRSSPT